jgi:hypothetical protein
MRWDPGQHFGRLPQVIDLDPSYVQRQWMTSSAVRSQPLSLLPSASGLRLHYSFAHDFAMSQRQPEKKPSSTPQCVPSKHIFRITDN